MQPSFVYTYFRNKGSQIQQSWKQSEIALRMKQSFTAKRLEGEEQTEPTETKKMMIAVVFGCALGLMFVATIKGIQHNNKVMKEAAKLHEQNMEQDFNS